MWHLRQVQDTVSSRNGRIAALLCLVWLFAMPSWAQSGVPRANPFDTLGRWHNRLLTVLMSQPDALYSHWTQIGLAEAGVSAAAVREDGGAVLSWQACYDAMPHQADNAEDRQRVYRLLRLSVPAEQHLEALFAQNTQAQQVEALEQVALQDTRLNDQERLWVLGSYSVARHSAQFWAAQQENVLEPQDTPRKKVKRESYIELSDDGLKRKRRKTDEVDIMEAPDSLAASPYSLRRDSTDTLSPGSMLMRRKPQPVPINKLLKADAFGLLKGAVSGGVLFGIGNLLLNVRETPLVVAFSGTLLVAPAVDSARYHRKWKRQQITETSVESIY